jgi:hypothetical protein
VKSTDGWHIVLTFYVCERITMEVPDSFLMRSSLYCFAAFGGMVSEAIQRAITSLTLQGAGLVRVEEWKGERRYDAANAKEDSKATQVSRLAMGGRKVQRH